MKIKLDSKSVTLLKGPENYRQWKQQVQMLVMACGAPYLLTTLKVLHLLPLSRSASKPAPNPSLRDEGEGFVHTTPPTTPAQGEHAA